MQLTSKLQKMIESPRYMRVIMYLIILNSIFLGFKSYDAIMLHYGFILDVLDDVLIFVFVCELMMYIYVFGYRRCFTDPWYIFDFIVIGIAFVPVVISVLSIFFHITDIPDLTHFSALRAMRVIRILRLVSIFPEQRKVIQGLLTAIPGIISIGTLLLILLYVSALIATNLYGDDFPSYFGTLQASLFSLFQIMSTEGWPDIARSVIAVHPSAWIFFISFILIATFIVLNLVIGVIVEAMTRDTEKAELAELVNHLNKISEKLDFMEDQISSLEKKK